jgi:hypothetical protein
LKHLISVSTKPAAAHIRFDGTATTTSGAPYANQFVWIFRMEDGVVVEAEAFLDHLYNSQLPQSVLKGRTPIAALKDWQRQRPELFRKRV